MPTVPSSVDGTPLFYRKYTPSSLCYRPGVADPYTAPLPEPTKPLTLVFLHGWPMSSRMWEHLTVPLCETYRYPIIAPDRRGFGNTDWGSVDVTYETFVGDLTDILKQALPKGDFAFIAASMGSAESVLTFLSSGDLQRRCKGIVWVGPNMPFSVLEGNPAAHPMTPSVKAWDALTEGFRGGRAEFTHVALPSVFNVEGMDPKRVVGPKGLEYFERIVAQADAMALEKTMIVFRKPVADELRRMAQITSESGQDGKLPILILHGDSDAGMPLEASAALVQDLLPWAELRVYEKAAHGLYLTHADQVLDDVLRFLRCVVSPGGQKEEA